MFFLNKKHFLFLEKYFFKIPKNSVAETDTEYHRRALAKPTAFADFRDNIIINMLYYIYIYIYIYICFIYSLLCLKWHPS